MSTIDDSKLLACNFVKNKAKITFLGYELETNEVVTYSAIPLSRIKRVSHQAVVGEYETLTYIVTLMNQNPFVLKEQFIDELDARIVYVPDSFKINGTSTTVQYADNALYIDELNIPANSTVNIEFKARAKFVLHEGQ